MTESAGELVAIRKDFDTVALGIVLDFEESKDGIYDWKIGDKVKVISE